MASTILVVEDEVAIQELIEVNLKSAGYHVVRAYCAESALELVNETKPDLMIVDWMLPGQSGISLIRRLRAKESMRVVPILMVTARGEEQDKILGLESGADDYMTKPFSTREMLARIEVLMRRYLPAQHNAAISVGGLQLDPSTQRVIAGNRVLSLGPIEFRLLHFFLKFPEHVHSRAHLLDKVWGNSAFIEERTVDTHVGRLRNALLPSGHDRLIETVRGSGYRFAASSHAAKAEGIENGNRHISSFAS